MDEKNKLSNAAILIEQLNKENEELKEKSIGDELDLALFKDNYKETLERAEELIAVCGSVIREYQELIAEAKQAKYEYESAKKEIYKLKKQYKKKLEELINHIG